MNDIVQEFVDKYRPSKLDDYMLDANLKSQFRGMIQSKSLQNFSVCGIQGSGKTTLARIIANEFDAEVLFVKCATEGTIDVLRSKVEPFCNAMSFEGKIKIVILDEIDSASQLGQNNFQLGLRTLIESVSDDTRFILTANFSNKIQPAILSRCPIIQLKFDKKDLFMYVKKILDSEKITYNKESLSQFVKQNFMYYPDCRRIINYLQICCNTGKLIVKSNQIADEDRNNLLSNLIKKIKEVDNVLDIRQYYISEKSKIDDYKILGAELFNYALDNNMITDAENVVKMSDMIYQMNLVVNPEIQFFALVCLIQETYHQNTSND